MTFAGCSLTVGFEEMKVFKRKVSDLLRKEKGGIYQKLKRHTLLKLPRPVQKGSADCYSPSSAPAFAALA